MYINYSYHIDDCTFAIRGTLSVEFDYVDPYRGNFTSVDDRVENLRVLADSAEIVNEHNEVVGRIDLLTIEQQATWGHAVLDADREGIEAACLEEGRKWAGVPA